MRESYWFVSTLMAIGALLLALGAELVNVQLPGDWMEHVSWLCAARLDGTRSLLSSIGGSMGAVRMCRAAIPAMRQRQWGRIVLFSSEDAVQPYVDELPYCASKAGIQNLTKGLSKAYGCDNVLVNVVMPAFIATPMTDKMMEKRAKEKGTSLDEAIDSFLEEERPGMTLKRRGRADEVAAAVAFLCSERSSFINGAALRVDSGSVPTIAT